MSIKDNAVSSKIAFFVNSEYSSILSVPLEIFP